MVMADQKCCGEKPAKKQSRESRERIDELEQTREVKIQEKLKINRKGGIL
jgi:hypothetical protein